MVKQPSRRDFMRKVLGGSLALASSPGLSDLARHGWKMLSRVGLPALSLESLAGCMGPAQYVKPETEKFYKYPALPGKKIQAPEEGCLIGFHSSDSIDASRGGYSWLEWKIGMGPKIMVPPYYRMENTYTRFAINRKLNVPEELINDDVAYPFLYRNMSPILAFVKLSEVEHDKPFRKKIEAYAKNITKLKRPMFFTTMEEMNGDWYPWGWKAKGFKKAWRFMHKVFEDNGANEYATWVWEPKAQSHSHTLVKRPQFYYPGDDYVDWVGVSVYREAIYPEFDKNLSSLAGYTIWDLHHSYPNKPLILSEMGSTTDSRQPDWFINAFSFIRKHPEIKGAVIWDNDNLRNGFYHSVSDESFAALKTIFTDPYFIGFRK